MNARMVKNIEPFSREELEDVLKPVEQATTLPARFYTDPDIYVLEREHILKKSWLCLGHTDQVSEVGDYFTLEVLEEPKFIYRARKFFAQSNKLFNYRLIIFGYRRWSRD